MTSPAQHSSPKPRALLRHLRPTDLKAAAQLATQATQGVVNIVEGMHRSVHRQLGLSGNASPEKTSGLTGQVHRGIRGVAARAGKGSDAVRGALLPLLDFPATHPEASPQREAVLAALNGGPPATRWRRRWSCAPVARPRRRTRLKISNNNGQRPWMRRPARTCCC